VTTQRRK